jgi:excisionase family DNA binding protein
VNSPLNPLAKPDPLTPRLALRPREAAAALGVSEKTLWLLTADGDVPHFRIGTCVLYPVRELREWLTKQAKSAASAPDSAPIGAESGENNEENAGSSSRKGTNLPGGEEQP